MTTGNIKISGSDESVALEFSLDMDLTVSNAQKVMVYVIELKATELAEAEQVSSLTDDVANDKPEGES